MLLIELDGAGPEPVSVAEAKAWCRIDRDDEDGLIAALIRAARQAIERETRLFLVRRRLRLVLEEVPDDGRIRAPCRPLVEVTAAIAYDADRNASSLGAGSAVPARGEADVILLSETARARAVNGLDLDLKAGLDTAAVPEALLTALKLIVAASYETRGALAPDMQPALVPALARALIAPFRERRL